MWESERVSAEEGAARGKERKDEREKLYLSPAIWSVVKNFEESA
jgi:hypothetical protein